jgi:hypothetical protein
MTVDGLSIGEMIIFEMTLGRMTPKDCVVRPQAIRLSKLVCDFLVFSLSCHAFWVISTGWELVIDSVIRKVQSCGTVSNRWFLALSSWK